MLGIVPKPKINICRYAKNKKGYIKASDQCRLQRLF